MRKRKRRKIMRCLSADMAELGMLDERKTMLKEFGLGHSPSELHRVKKLTRRIAEAEFTLGIQNTDPRSSTGESA